MPWPKDHKSRTRDRIVHAAAAAFRARGISAVRVEDVMASAGLTHGGFYAHFPSKDDLLRAALDHAGGETDEVLSKPLASVALEQRIHAAIDAYLSDWHAANPDRGCPVAALAPELMRSGSKARRDLARSVQRRIEWARELLTTERENHARSADAIGVVACMVGGVILARAAGGKDAPAVLDACRTFLHDAVRETAPRHATSGTNRRSRRRKRD